MEYSEVPLLLIFGVTLYGGVGTGVSDITGF